MTHRARCESTRFPVRLRTRRGARENSCVRFHLEQCSRDRRWIVPSARRHFPARTGPRTAGRGASDASLIDQITNELSNAWIVLLAEPKQRLLAELQIGIALRDRHQLVDRGRFTALRVDEEQMVLELSLIHISEPTRLLSISY